MTLCLWAPETEHVTACNNCRSRVPGSGNSLAMMVSDLAKVVLSTCAIATAEIISNRAYTHFPFIRRDSDLILISPASSQKINSDVLGAGLVQTRA